MFKLTAIVTVTPAAGPQDARAFPTPAGARGHTSGYVPEREEAECLARAAQSVGACAPLERGFKVAAARRTIVQRRLNGGTDDYRGSMPK